MPRISFLASAKLLLLLSFCLIALRLDAVPQTLPDEVVHAHSVFLLNETGFNELEYSAIFELNKWGRFDLAESAGKADLVLRLDGGNHIRAVPDDELPSAVAPSQANETEIPKGHTRVSLLDPKTGVVLWSDTHKTEGGKVKNGHLLDGLRDAFNAYEKSRR